MPVIDDRGALDAEMTVHVYGPARRDRDRSAPGDPHLPEGRRRRRRGRRPRARRVRPARPAVAVHARRARRRRAAWCRGSRWSWPSARHVDWGERRGAVRARTIRRDQLQPLARRLGVGARAGDGRQGRRRRARADARAAAEREQRAAQPRRGSSARGASTITRPTSPASCRRSWPASQAGLGLDARRPRSTPAWGTARTTSPRATRATWSTLPVYYSWSFGTGEEGNFESLARKLQAAVAPPGVGRRRVDATHAVAGRSALDADDPGAEMVVTGPVVSPQAPGDRAAGARGPTEARAALGAGRHRRRSSQKLNRPDDQAHAGGSEEPPLVGPPLYGGDARAPAARSRPRRRAWPRQPQWFRELNLDPRHRIVGGLGTRVVQAEQEDLMAGGLEPGDRRRGGQPGPAPGPAGEARRSASLHRRHLSRFTDAALVVGDRARARQGARRAAAQRLGVARALEPAADGHRRARSGGWPACADRSSRRAVRGAARSAPRRSTALTVRDGPPDHRLGAACTRARTASRGLSALARGTAHR